MEITGFRTGVNYWPIGKAMYWWRNFSARELKNDFRQIALYGMELVRIFLLWEDFQPHPNSISSQALSYLTNTADIAKENGIKIIVTFFCGHMSGANWIPFWLLKEAEAPNRFPLFSQGKTPEANIANFYHDPLLREAQTRLLKEVCSSLKNHPAIWAYDLGNETSNCLKPDSYEEAQEWLRTMCTTIKSSDPDSLVTIGLHAEDLEEDRRLRPQEAGMFCDFLTMHGYPFYLSWAESPQDALVLPFLVMLTEWLGQKPVLLSEFGIPSQPAISPFYESPYQGNITLFSESETALYYEKALPLLRQGGALGAMAWCYGDYAPKLWYKVPLDKSPHERHFGLFRHDGSPKPVAKIMRSFAGRNQEEITRQLSGDFLNNWNRDMYYENPRIHLGEMYKEFREENPAFLAGLS